ncbi:MAG TPA: cupin domain-containing protein [Polyangiaceae bacterium]|nr:cupin domain-containing protein [Polyangiaceae bacterium]
MSAFLREHWNRRALHVRGCAGKWRALYAPEKWSWLERAHELEAASSEGGVQRQFRIEPERVATLFDAGCTICANMSADPALAWLAQFGAELGLAGTPFAKIYASPDGGGFALHFDMFHVFVLQLEGKKSWRFSREPAVVAPLCGGKLAEDGAPVWSFPHDGEPMLDDAGEPIVAPQSLEEVVLEEGDCLYLPPGTWHVARAFDHSLAVSVSPPRTPIYQLIARTLEDHLIQNEALRHDVFASESALAHGRAPPEIAQQFEGAIDALKALLDRLDRRMLHRVWRLNVPTPAIEGSATTIQPDDTLVHASDELRRYLVASEPQGPEAIFFYACGSEWSLPIEALRFVEALAKQERFVAKDACTWDPALAWDDVREMLEQLVAAGLLRCVSGRSVEPTRPA